MEILRLDPLVCVVGNVFLEFEKLTSQDTDKRKESYCVHLSYVCLMVFRPRSIFLGTVGTILVKT